MVKKGFVNSVHFWTIQQLHVEFSQYFLSQCEFYNALEGHMPCKSLLEEFLSNAVWNPTEKQTNKSLKWIYTEPHIPYSPRCQTSLQGKQTRHCWVFVTHSLTSLPPCIFQTTLLHNCTEQNNHTDSLQSRAVFLCSVSFHHHWKGRYFGMPPFCSTNIAQ